MRVYGRVVIGTTPEGAPIKKWVVVETDAQGFNDAVYLTALAQCLLLNLGESPVWSRSGIPAHQSVLTQVFPDAYVIFTQQMFAPLFASLQIAREDLPTPTYRINVLTHQGVRIEDRVPI